MATSIKKRVFNEDKCSSCIRGSFQDKIGRTIILSGKHAFKWHITVIWKNTSTIYEFSNRIEATKEYNKYKSKRI